MTEATLSIGEVAAKARISVSAIRFYERRGLLPVAERVAGRRRFGPDTVRRLEIIAVGKRAGFSLEEIRRLLDSIDRRAPAHEQLQTLAAGKLPEIDAAIERAQAKREWLAAARVCGCDSLDDCVLFAA
jgi:DNA-binding transcriptional MerR regulator